METIQIHDIVDLIRNNTISVKQTAYIWKLMDESGTIIITGSTGSGKTTLLNALAGLSKPYSYIDIYEDTLEINLKHLPLPPTSHYKDKLRSSVKKQPHLTIIGELRDGVDCDTFFQVSEDARTTMSTFHGSSIDDAISRLSEDPLNISPDKIARVHFVGIARKISGRKANWYHHNGSEELNITPEMKDDLETRQTLLYKACADNRNSFKILQSYYK